MRLHEINVIGSAVRRDEIPKEYQNLKLLGRGATSLAFEKDPETVILFTRDAMKKDWLAHGLHMMIGSKIVSPVRSHHIRGMNDIPLYAIEMPKLYPLSSENLRRVNREVKDWQQLHNDASIHSNGKDGKQDQTKYINYLIQKYEDDHPDSIIALLISFLADYHPGQYRSDIATRQFKQDKDGNIILLDPVVDRELWNLFSNHRTTKGKSQWY